MIKTIDLDAMEFIAKRNSEIVVCHALIFITLIFSLATLGAVWYRLDAIKATLGL